MAINVAELVGFQAWLKRTSQDQPQGGLSPPPPPPWPAIAIHALEDT